MNPAAPAADLIYDVTDADFEQRVIERSMEVPVLLDCWAPWCGPCKSLKPLLEELVQAYGGQFVLPKLNTDENPGLAQALQLRSIPAVFFISQGQVKMKIYFCKRRQRYRHRVSLSDRPAQKKRAGVPAPTRIQF